MHNLIRLLILVIGLVCSLTATTQAIGITSSRLTDVIKSTGQGTIDLSKDITLGVGNTLLESYRREGSGALLFGVDVNEAASGTEKAAATIPAVLRSRPYTPTRYRGSHSANATKAPKTKK